MFLAASASWATSPSGGFNRRHRSPGALWAPPRIMNHGLSHTQGDPIRVPWRSRTSLYTFVACCTSDMPRAQVPVFAAYPRDMENWQTQCVLQVSNLVTSGFNRALYHLS